jgi:hypothetical protein
MDTVRPYFTPSLFPGLEGWKKFFFRINLYGFILLLTIFVPLNEQPEFPWAPQREVRAIQPSAKIIPDTLGNIYPTWLFADMMDFWHP